MQIIAAFTLLPPESLGFDPTTRLLVSSNQALPSYKPTAEFIEAYKAAPYNRRWVITMNSGLEYMTVKTVSYVQAGFMRGRGPIVWVVVPYGEGKQESEPKVCCSFESLSRVLNELLFQALCSETVMAASGS